jgi:hypothetical protein
MMLYNLINSLYAKRPEGCRTLSLFFIQTFGTALINKQGAAYVH